VRPFLLRRPSRRELTQTRSLSRTPRALAHAPHTCTGTLCSMTFVSASASGGQPTGTTELAITVRISDRASPSRDLDFVSGLGEGVRVMKWERRLRRIRGAPGALDQDPAFWRRLLRCRGRPQRRQREQAGEKGSPHLSSERPSLMGCWPVDGDSLYLRPNLRLS
jgi:hypothetical protein